MLPQDWLFLIKKNGVFWDVTPCGSCKNRRYIGELGTTLAATRNRRTQVYLRSVHRLLVAASVVPSSPIIVTLMKEALGSSETSVLTRATRRNFPEDDILHSHRRENLKSDKFLITSSGQVVSRRFPTAAVGVRARFKPWGSMADRMTLNQVSSEYFGFPCQSSIQLIAQQSSPSIMEDWYNRPINGRSNGGLGSIAAPWINKKLINNN
jgi:hypothetical protein